LQPQSRQMKTVGLALSICACIARICSNASAQLAQNQTNSFGNNRLVTFTYLQNFDCVDQPKLDLDFNGIPIPMKCRRRFASLSSNPRRIQLAGTSNTRPTSRCSFRCSRSTMTQNPNDKMPCPKWRQARRALRTYSRKRVDLAFHLNDYTTPYRRCWRWLMKRASPKAARNALVA